MTPLQLPSILSALACQKIGLHLNYKSLARQEISERAVPQPSEPRLFANLRRYFADFPYLHWSIDQRFLTLETCCGYWYGRVWYPPADETSPSEKSYISPTWLHSLVFMVDSCRSGIPPKWKNDSSFPTLSLSDLLPRSFTWKRRSFFFEKHTQKSKSHSTL